MFHFNLANAQAGKSITYEGKQPTIILGNSQKPNQLLKKISVFLEHNVHNYHKMYPD
jgi:hypothetical protein